MTIKIRRYYGYDCDSEIGFNNGQYIDEPKGIEVDDIDTAYEKCLETLAYYWTWHESELHEFGDDTHGGYEVVTGYYHDGKELDCFEWLNLDSDDKHYSYVFVAFDVIDEQ